jgi:hypothetical protein
MTSNGQFLIRLFQNQSVGRMAGDVLGKIAELS